MNYIASCKAIVQVPLALGAENSEEEMVAKVLSNEEAPEKHSSFMRFF